MMDEQGVSPAWVAAVYGSLALLCGAVATRGMMGDQTALLTTGLLGLVVVGCTLPLALKRSGGTGGAAGPNGSSKAAEAELHEVRGQLRTLARAIQDLQECMVLSDDARRVLNRKRERELLRKAIQEDINAEDWDAAMVLIRELAERFGYRSDAEEFRQKVETARFTTMDRRVNEAVRGLEELIVRNEWDAALEEAARIARLFPDSPKTEGLRHRVIASRDRYKIDLERRFLHAAQAERVDEAMELLRQLDQYLTESEGEQFREVARGVIGKARENLGAQFRLAVQDRQWELAAELGDRIIDEFPNTRMASEVRAMIDTIRERAGAMRR
jgi:tetratricopeptide (TPR) repeat protein